VVKYGFPVPAAKITITSSSFAVSACTMIARPPPARISATTASARSSFFR